MSRCGKIITCEAIVYNSYSHIFVSNLTSCASIFVYFHNVDPICWCWVAPVLFQHPPVRVVSQVLSLLVYFKVIELYIVTKLFYQKGQIPCVMFVQFLVENSPGRSLANTSTGFSGCFLIPKTCSCKKCYFFLQK